MRTNIKCGICFCSRKSSSETKVSAETHVIAAEATEAKEMESDDHFTYQEFMQLDDNDKVLHLYMRLRDQEEKLKEVENRLRNRGSSSGVFGGVTGVIITISSILALAYIYRKKLQL